MEHNLSHKIEALLFATAQPYSVTALSERLSCSTDEIEKALGALEDSLSDRALMLVRNGSEVTFATRPEHSALLEQVRKEELSKELSKASAETLATILYRPGISKTEIEFIRGVNVSYSLRALSIRGLVESRGGGRSVGYHPTLTLLEYFGVKNVEDLPEYQDTAKKIATLLEGSNDSTEEQEKE